MQEVKKLNKIMMDELIEDIVIDSEKNMEIASYLDINEGCISVEESKVPVYVIPTNEELMIALDTYDLIKDGKSN